ncbi:MAG: VCBS repeat-containing protein, partial [Candidatus Sulfotelmatobacter sp.]
MKKLLLLWLSLILGSVQILEAQSKLSQFSTPSAKQRIALEAAAEASVQARAAAMPGRPALAHGIPATPSAAGKVRSARSRPNTSNPPVNPVAFVSALQIPAGGATSWSAVAADFNGDGKLDVAAPVESNYNPQTSTATYAVSVVLSNGNGTFQSAVLTANPNGTDGDQILVGDFNKDGIQDLIVVHSTSPSTFEVWLGNGDGTFQVGGNVLNPISPNYLIGGVVTGPDTNGNLDLTFIDDQSPANVWTVLGNGDGTFSQTPTSVALSGGPLSNVVFADFNGDGILDFAATSSTRGPNVVYFGQANGTYVPGSPLSNSDNFYYVCNNSAGDLNGDGKPELVSANCNSSSGAGNLTVYVNNGDGTFQTGVYYSAGTESTDNTIADISPLAITIADVNGDGKNDIVSSNHAGGDVTVLLGNGDGTVNVPTVGYSTGGYPKTSALVADFNGDGLADVIVPDYKFSFAYLQGYGDGAFRSALDYYSPVPGGYNAGGTTIASGNFNGDGYPDFVVGNYGYNPNTPSGIGITVFLSNPDGSLQPGVNYGTGGSYEGVTVADFDGDSNLDIAAVNQSNNGIQIFHGNGNGSFSLGSYYPSGGTDAYIIATGDFNRDGHPDLAVANYSSDNVSVFLNDGTGAFLPAVLYPTGGNNAFMVVGDVNNDGIPDLVVAEYDPGVVAVLLGTANGTFQAASTPSFGFNDLGSMALGDLDGDGKLDLAVAVDDPSVGTGLAVAKGNGDGTFQPPVFYSTTLE